MTSRYDYEQPATRVWRKGDPEPPTSITLLRNQGRAHAELRYLARADNGWWWVDSPDEAPPAGQGWRWPALRHGVELVAVRGGGQR